MSTQTASETQADAPGPQRTPRSHHHLRGNGIDPHIHDVAVPADHARRDRRPGHRSGRGGCGTRFEFECYHIGHLYSLAHIIDRSLIKLPFFVQSIFGILGGIGADPENVMHMRRIADQVRLVRGIPESLSYEIPTPDRVRELLALKKS